MVRQPNATPPTPEQIEAWVEATKLLGTTDVHSLNSEASGWTEYMLCESSDSKIYRSKDPADIEAAKAICAVCVVREPCLEYALIVETRHPLGDVIWGGKTLTERQEILGLEPKPPSPTQSPGAEHRIRDVR